MAKRGNVLQILNKIAQEFGIEPSIFSALAEIESGYDPSARTGSYRGLFQMSKNEFNKYGNGDIYNAEDNARAAAKKVLADSQTFKRRVGRDPTPTDLYMMHQQGRAGSSAHARNPSGVAWKNIRPYYSDAAAKKRGFSSGDAYAKAAIWGNLPASAKRRFQNVDNVTSQDFTGWWGRRVARGIVRNGGDAELVNASFRGGTPVPERPAGRVPERRPMKSSILGGKLPEDAGGPRDRSASRSSNLTASSEGIEFEPIPASLRKRIGEIDLPDRPTPRPDPTAGPTDFSPNVVNTELRGFDAELRALNGEGGAGHMAKQGGILPNPKKDQSRLRQGAPQISASPAQQQGGTVTPPMPERNTLASSGFTPELLDRTFGEPFGSLFQNQGSMPIMGGRPTPLGSVPPPVPLFKNFFSRFGGIR